MTTMPPERTRDVADLPDEEEATYAPEANTMRARPWRRRVRPVLLSLALLAGVAAISGVWMCTGHLRAQHRISHQVLPPGTVIYTEDPLRIAQVRHRSDYRSKRETWGEDYPADAWERAYSSESFPAIDGPRGDIADFQVDDTFGCRRMSAGGVEWIVKLDQANAFQNAEVPPGHRYVVLTQSAFRPAGWSPGARGVRVSHMSAGIVLGPSDHLTLFAPQPDKADASKATVAYELNGRTGELSATVRDNGGVSFAIASGPARLLMR